MPHLHKALSLAASVAQIQTFKATFKPLTNLKTEPIKISGFTLIDKALEFGSMTNVESDWILNKQKDNSSRYVRLQQINILLSIFTPETFDSNNISSGFDSLLNGDFILQRDIKLYKNVFTKMDELITSSNFRPEKRNEWCLDELRHNYVDIIRFKNNLQNVITHNSGIMEISYPYFYSVIITEEILKRINTKKLDKFLSLVIDPFERTIKKNILTKSHNYPIEDIYEIDLDNW